jgi:hypothetical protein
MKRKQQFKYSYFIDIFYFLQTRELLQWCSKCIIISYSLVSSKHLQMSETNENFIDTDIGNILHFMRVFYNSLVSNFPFPIKNRLKTLN